MESKVNTRNKEFDFLKGILIFGVTFGHVISAFYSTEPGFVPPWIYVIIRSYDMPMFALIAGIFLNKSIQRRSMWRNICNKCFTLLLPALFWELIFGLIKRNVRLGTSCWFLYALFFSSVILILISGVKSTPIRLALYGVAIIATHLIPDPVHTSFLLTPMIAGLLISEIYPHIRIKKGVLHTALLIAWVLMLCFWDAGFSVWNISGYVINVPLTNILIILYRDAIGIVGSLCMIIISFVIYRNLPVWNTVKSWLVEMGKITMEQYILQVMLVSYFGAIAIDKISALLQCNPFIFNDKFLVYVLCPIVVVITMIVQAYLQKFIKKIPFLGKYLFGSSIYK